MKASEAKVGEKYLSKTGATVTKTGEKDGKIVMTLDSGIVFRCGPDYELKPIKGADGKVHNVKAWQKGKAAKVVSAPEQKIAIGTTAVKPPRATSLAAIIDPMILTGGHTVKEIAAELGKCAGDAAQGKDLNANVRARLVTYTRKGWTVAKDDKKRVKVIQPKG